MTAIYNEIDAGRQAWLRNLIASGSIAPGRVDGRSISDLRAVDVVGPGQRHFFAGIAGWSLGLRLAGVPDDATIWTGSCPCQSLSVAGLQRGADDPRHLWPAWHELIAECLPPIIVGEQASGEAGLAWLTAVRDDLEGLGYAVGASDLCAAGVGAPHIRQRIYWGAYRVGDAYQDAVRRDTGAAHREEAQGSPAFVDRSHALGPGPASDDVDWSSVEWLEFDDPVRGRLERPAEPGALPLAHGLPDTLVRLRAYGDAIVPGLAAQFIGAFLDAVADGRPS